MRHADHRIHGPDGAELFVRQYAPDRPQLQRTLVVVHGAGEHSGRYQHFIERATGDGWTVIAGDLRGHGQSTGVPTHVDDFDHYVDDVAAVWEYFEFDPQRTVLFGHSLGGLIAVRFAQTRPDHLAGLVLSSPLLAFGIRVPRLKRAFGRMCLWVAPQARFRTTISPDQITRNELALQQRETDPFTNRTVTAGWYFRVLEGLCKAWRDTEQLTTPLLLLQGEDDAIVDPHAPLQWLPTVGSRDVTLRLIHGHLHELLNEPTWEWTTAEILHWISRRVPAAAGEGALQAAYCRY